MWPRGKCSNTCCNFERLRELAIRLKILYFRCIFRISSFTEGFDCDRFSVLQIEFGYGFRQKELDSRHEVFEGLPRSMVHLEEFSRGQLGEILFFEDLGTWPLNTHRTCRAAMAIPPGNAVDRKARPILPKTSCAGSSMMAN